ncbi:hypothetical protein WMY93_019403 [Mugilogobius chulae]|uniref:Uncharacterized protein n=1 Tax=Mugilogobius chulae TaxID=88201 RepID=A0AAW0NJ24_9GOBI
MAQARRHLARTMESAVPGPGCLYTRLPAFLGGFLPAAVRCHVPEPVRVPGQPRGPIHGHMHFTRARLVSCLSCFHNFTKKGFGELQKSLYFYGKDPDDRRKARRIAVIGDGLDAV